MAQSSIEIELKERLEEVARSASCELLHADFRGGTLRLVLDRPEGVTLDDCTRVSHLASALLDAEDFGEKRYVLEVSSPGLDRQLYRPQDYARFVGRRVRVTFRDAASGRKQTISGRLEAFDPEAGGAATVLAAESGTTHVIPLQDIQLAKLEIEL